MQEPALAFFRVVFGALRATRTKPGHRESLAYNGRHHSLKSLSDDELLRRLSAVQGQSRLVEADVVDHIGEVDERRLYAREASP